MSKTVLKDGVRFQVMLEQDLRSVTESLRQQLLETQVSVLRHNQELDKRIQENTLLWPHQGTKKAQEDK